MTHRVADAPLRIAGIGAVALAASLTLTACDPEDLAAAGAAATGEPMPPVASASPAPGGHAGHGSTAPGAAPPGPHDHVSPAPGGGGHEGHGVGEPPAGEPSHDGHGDSGDGHGGDHDGGHGGAHGDGPPLADEYPAEFRHLLYDPAGFTHGEHAGGHGHGGGPCEPTEDEIRWANDFAVGVGRYVEQLPVFPDEAAAQGWLEENGFVSFDLGPISDATGDHQISIPNSIAAHGKAMDPDLPTTLIMIQTNEGYRTVGVMYSGDAANPPTTPGGCLVNFHVHEGAEGLGSMVHVWTYGPPGGAWSEEDCGLERRRCVDEAAARLR
jgi:hypothetical protein